MIDAELIVAATAEAASKKDLPGLARLEYIRWAEGRCAQLLHIGPYAAEAPSIAALHEAHRGSRLPPPRCPAGPGGDDGDPDGLGRFGAAQR